jgi:hypothetical protein
LPASRSAWRFPATVLADSRTAPPRCASGKRPGRSSAVSGVPGTPLALVTPLWDGVRNAAPPQQPPAPREAVTSVGDKMLGSFAWPPGGALRAHHPDGVEHHSELGALVALARGHDHRQRSPSPAASQMQLGRQPSPAPPERLVLRVGDPLFASSRLGARRAPAACWCAREIVLSTLTSHITSPAASEFICTWANSRSQVPSRLQRAKRS